MYPVQWSRSARNDLAEIWLRSDTARRKAVTQIVNEIDQRLAADPIGAGESRDQGRRILIVRPLALIYRIDPEGVVRILSVWTSRGS
ncbi:MAG: type II toxin-antitoxin system RelE/ParE family toxin [Planctomycetota bacterium]|nr:type II toxin-antitoxin system RelE/ParE family toxin [Planctomycetaceae bacterium]MDQ3331084.1 type II toxin-antitoxin system RelE/ParE family toxin [Planctomycetota bacterium]